VFGLQERRQKRVIYASLIASVLASVVWLVAISTNGWVELVLPEHGVYLPSVRHDARGRSVLVEKIWTGLWNLCRVECANATASNASSTDNESLDQVKGILIETTETTLCATRSTHAYWTHSMGP